MVGVRPIRESDEAVLVALRAVADDERRTKRGGEHPSGFGPSDSAPSSVERAVFVGTIGDAVVGFASLTRAGVRAVLEELFTHPEARGVGVGAAMLAGAMAHAREWGCSDLDSFALPGDRSTKNFFESHAMKSRLLVVHCDLVHDD